MLRTNKPVYKVILILCLISIGVSAYFSCCSIVNSKGDLIAQIAHSFNIFASVFAAFYILSGYRKNSAKYYKDFGIFLALSQTAFICKMADNRLYTNLVINAIKLIVILVLVLSENLGKTKSLVLSGALVISNVVNVLGLPTNSDITHYYGIVTAIIIYFLYFVMTYAKYLDKASRGAK